MSYINMIPQVLLEEEEFREGRASEVSKDVFLVPLCIICLHLNLSHMTLGLAKALGDR